MDQSVDRSDTGKKVENWPVARQDTLRTRSFRHDGKKTYGHIMIRRQEEVLKFPELRFDSGWLEDTAEAR